MISFLKQVFATLVGIFLFAFLLVFILVGFSSSFFLSEELSKSIKKEKSILEIHLSNPILESELEIPFSIKNSKNEHLFLKDILKSLEIAKTDSKIDGISLRISSPKMGMTQMSEIRNALSDFKSSGKFVYAYQKNVTQNAYFLNSIADSIFQHPLGKVEFKGLGSEVIFYKDLAEKFGIRFDVLKQGDFKGAVEPYVQNSLSKENRLQIQILINDLWKIMSESISKSRGINLGVLNRIADDLSAGIPEEALKLGVVDKLLDEKAYESFLRKKIKVNESKEVNYLIISDLIKKKRKSSSKNHIAVLHLSGEILPGKGRNAVHENTFLEAIESIKEKENLAGLVLRVNSPGGSADASDAIYNSLLDLKEKIPVYASFGDISASGGYYIAMAADSIFAQPTSIVGSIGVFGILPNFSELASKNGVNSEIVQTNKNSILYSSINGLNSQSKLILEKNMKNFYLSFLDIVAENRNMEIEQIDSLAGGRIYSGEDALEIALIDDFSSLEEVIKRLAESEELDEFWIDEYPKAKIDLFAELENQLKLRVFSSQNPLLKEIRNKQKNLIHWMIEPGGEIQALFPYQLNIQ